MQNYKTIFSLRIRLALREKGIEPIMEQPNPYKKGLKCWVYENSQELNQALQELFQKEAIQK